MHVTYLLRKQLGDCFLTLCWNMNLQLIDLKFIRKVTILSTTVEHENAKTVRKENSTKLLACFCANRQYPNARHIHYTDFPKYFRWDKGRRLCKSRTMYKARNISRPQYDFSNTRERVISRMYNISPREGEQYFL